MQDIKEVSRLRLLGLSQRTIAKQCRISRNTVKLFYDFLDSRGWDYHTIKDFDWLQIIDLIELQLKSVRELHYELPDYEKLVKELSKPGVTMQLLWEEYVQNCRRSNQLYYQITQFKKHFHDHINTHSFTDVIQHKPGERIEVDWAGTPVMYMDPDHGGMVSGSLFVAVLPFSGYTFAWACPDQKQASWIDAHLRMFSYFGGVSQLLVPDNLKTGVIKHPKYEDPILNVSYREMAEHYGCVVLPTRVRKPKDKASVENSVNQLTRFIIARLRNHQFFTLMEYNEQLLITLDAFNHKPFQKKPGSRSEAFEQFEQAFLRPLPKYPYAFCQWRKAKVQMNSHIQFEKRYYSVPYRFIGNEIEVKVYADHLEMIASGSVIAQHKRLGVPMGGYSTIPDHMPPQSLIHQNWSKERFIREANLIGIHTTKVIEQIFENVKHEAQGYKTAVSVLKLAELYSVERLENACRRLLEKGQYPRYKHLKTLLQNGQDKMRSSDIEADQRSEKAFVRGGQYYARKA